MNFFIQIKESVVDFKFYTKIKDNRFSRSFLYLMLLFLIIYSLGAIGDFVYLKYGVDEAANYINESLSDFRLQNGEFSYDGEMPKYLANNSQEMYVIDTTGQVTEDMVSNAENGILIMKSYIYVKRPGDSGRIYYKDLQGLSFTRKSLIDFMPKLNWIILAILAVGFSFMLAYKLLNALLLALIAMIANTTIKAEFNYKQVLNISIYALTLPMLLELAVKLSGYTFTFFSLIYWLVSYAYIIIAMRTCIANRGINPYDSNGQ